MSELNKWRERIGLAEQNYDNAKSYEGWERYLEYYNTRYDQNLGLKVPVIAVNEVFAYVETSVGSLYYTDPYITCNAITEKGVVSAFVKEQVLNYYWRRKLKMKRQIRKAIRETEIVGRSWVKVGYDPEIEVKNVDEKGNVNEYIKSDDLYAIKIDYDDILYDTEAEDPPHDCRWIIHKYYLPTSYIEEKYKVQIDPDKTISFNKESKNQDFNRSLVYEIWDKDSESVYFYTPKLSEQFLEVKESEGKGCIGPYKMEGFPFVMLNYYDIVQNHYNDKDKKGGYFKHNFPMSPIKPQEPQILEKIKLRSMQLEHIKRYNRQLLIEKGVIEPADLDKIERGEIGAIIPVNGNPQTAVHALSYPSIQADIYAVENRVDVDRDKISGQTGGQQGGVTATKSRTLGEIKERSSGTAGRNVVKLDAIEDFCEEIAKKLGQLMMQFFDQEKYARIVGNPPVAMLKKLQAEDKFDGVTIKYTKSDIQEPTDDEIVIGSMAPMTKEQRLKTELEMLRFGPAIGLVPGSNASMALGKSIMKDLGLKNIEAAYNMDLLQQQKPKKPSAAQQLAVIDKTQKIKKNAVDTELKKSRLEGSNLTNVNRALGNAEKLTEEPNAL